MLGCLFSCFAFINTIDQGNEMNRTIAFAHKLRIVIQSL